MSVKLNSDSFKENATVLTVFLVAVHLLYANTWQAGFVTDFTGLLSRLEGAPFSDFLNCFGFPALHQATNFFLYIFHKLFGIEPLGWYFVFTSLHILNGFLGYRMAKKLFNNSEKIPFLFNISASAFVASFLFLINPYNAEAVVWKVCFNFLFCTLCILSSLLFFIKYLEKGNKHHFIFSLLFFIFGLFTFELALVLPVMIGLIVFSKSKKPKIDSQNKLLASVPYFVILPFYFIINKVFLGGWVGHYGESVHLSFNLKSIGATCLKYFAKYSIYWRNWNHSTKESFIAFCESNTVSFVFIAICSSLFLFGFYYLKKLKPKTFNTWLLFSLFFVALAPVSNLYVAWILNGENDRYGYLASLFFYSGLVALLQYFKKEIKYGAYILSAGISISFLVQINTYWQNSTEVIKSLLSDFRWMDNSEVYVLAFPENYKGIPMFKDFSKQDRALKDALKYISDKPTQGDFYQVAQYNLNSIKDGLSGFIDSTGTINLEFHEWGSWWWRNGIGTGGYETDSYIFNPLPKGCKIKIKNSSNDAVFIYSDGKNWKKIKAH